MTSFDGPAIGRRVAAYRKLNGWTRDDLADRTGETIRRDVIANIEGGRKKDLSVPQFIALAQALSVPPLALLVDLTDLTAPADVAVASESGDLRGLTNIGFIRWFAGTMPLDSQGEEDELLPSQVQAGKLLYAIHDLAAKEDRYASALAEYGIQADSAKGAVKELLRNRIEAAWDDRERARRKVSDLGILVGGEGRDGASTDSTQ